MDLIIFDKKRQKMRNDFHFQGYLIVDSRSLCSQSDLDTKPPTTKKFKNTFSCILFFPGQYNKRVSSCKRELSTTQQNTHIYFLSLNANSLQTQCP